MSDVLHAIGFVLLAGTVFLALMALERAHWLRRSRPDAYDLRESLANVSTGLMYKLFDGVFVAAVIAVLFDEVRAFGLGYTPGNPWVGYLLLFIATDFVFYVAHVAMHKVRYGWCSHVTHHSSTRFNLSTALRQNFLFDLSGMALLWWVPLALIGFDKMAVIVAVELNLFYQFFLHTEAVGRLPRWFEAVFNTPSHHRVHHGRNPAQIDTNFGGVLIVWDRLFGTFVDERDAGPVVYGLGHRQPTTLNPLRLNLDEWFAMWRDVWRHRDLRIIWKHPDWVETRYPQAPDSATTPAPHRRDAQRAG